MADKFTPKVTKNGTELPLLNLKGKPYLQVAHRLVWFREDHPNGVIKTQILHQQNDEVIVRAEIFMMTPQGPVPLASAHKMETKAHFPDYIEKAETGAIGRALAMVGYGTQYEPEFDEGDRLADSPIAAVTKSSVGGTSGTVDTSSAAPSATAVTTIPTFRKPKAATAATTDDI